MLPYNLNAPESDVEDLIRDFTSDFMTAHLIS